MASISVCIISFNEEDQVADCLESVSWADEIILVDSHSQDGTREIAARFTDRIFERAWPGHVEQKNFAAQQATSEWILGLDCDERVSPELRASIQAMLQTGDPGVDAFEVARKSYHLGRWWTRAGWYPDSRIRVWRRGRGRWGGDNPHDRVEVDGPVGQLEGDLLHYTYDDLQDHVGTVNSFTSIAAQAKMARGQRYSLFKLLFHPLGKFLNMYVWKRGFLDGVPGFILCTTSAFYVFLKYAKMWEAERVKAKR